MQYFRCYMFLLVILITLVFQPATANYTGRVDLLETIKENKSSVVLANRQRTAYQQPSGYQWLNYGEDDEESDRVLGLERDSTPLLLPPRPCPGGERFCSRAEDYPKDYIRELLKKEKPINDFFFADGDNAHLKDEDTNIKGNYIGISPNEENLCPTRVMTRYIQKARDITGIMRFIVNQENTRQAVLMEHCLNENNVDIECEIPGTLSNFYKSYCKQKYSIRTMATLDERGKLIGRQFEFPAACCCVLIKNKRYTY